jgi:triosephosphate isomerase (TIM)
VVFPSALDVRMIADAGMETGSQGACAKPCGACTGEISMSMFKDSGCTYVLCGHSERRKCRNETDDDVAEQVIMALELGLRPIVCVGETTEERAAKKIEKVLEKQLKKIPFDERVVIAYEPLWAIGTGKTPEPSDIQTVATMVKKDMERGNQLFLYGGSLDSKNCHAILQEPDVGGALIGGASLKIDEFSKIVDTAAMIR